MMKGNVLPEPRKTRRGSGSNPGLETARSGHGNDEGKERFFLRCFFFFRVETAAENAVINTAEHTT